jgi:hypothetical protein
MKDTFGSVIGWWHDDIEDENEKAYLDYQTIIDEVTLLSPSPRQCKPAGTG